MTAAVKPSLPPGPRSRLLTTLRLARAPTRHLPRWRDRYGDPFTLPLATGRVVVTADAAEIRRIFTAEPDTFEIYSPRTLVPILGEGSFPFGGGTRRCLGAAFARFEMKVVLGTLLGAAEFRRLPSRRADKLVRRNLTMGPADGVPLELVALRSG